MEDNVISLILKTDIPFLASTKEKVLPQDLKMEDVNVISLIQVYYI